jgi:hemoglobin
VSANRRVSLQQQNRDSKRNSDVEEGRRGGSLFEQLGGERKLRAIIETFIDRVFADRMIGFFFRHSSKERIKQMEYQLAASFLGAPVEYEGRPLDEVHAKHPIMGGHFERRRQLLKETLEFYQVPEAVKEAWLIHTDELRSLITPEQGSACDSNSVRQRAGST